MQAAVLAEAEKEKSMKNYRDHSIAYALAAGIAPIDDQDGEKHGRRQRYKRRKASKSDKRKAWRV